MQIERRQQACWNAPELFAFQYSQNSSIRLFRRAFWRPYSDRPYPLPCSGDGHDEDTASLFGACTSFVWRQKTQTGTQNLINLSFIEVWWTICFRHTWSKFTTKWSLMTAISSCNLHNDAAPHDPPLCGKPGQRVFCPVTKPRCPRDSLAQHKNLAFRW